MINPLKFVSKIFKSHNQKELDRLKKITENINLLEKDTESLKITDSSGNDRDMTLYNGPDRTSH